MTRRDPGLLCAVNDAELMRRVQTGDARAFDALHARHVARVAARARTLCDTPERAEEAVQDTFLCVWRARSTYDPSRGSVTTWLYGLLSNRSIDIHRRNRRGDALRAPDAGLRALPAPTAVEDDAVRRDEDARLRSSLWQLPDAQREVIVLAYFGELTHLEIAAHLDLPLGTVKGRMRLGLDRARVELPGHDRAAAAPDRERVLAA